MIKGIVIFLLCLASTVCADNIIIDGVRIDGVSIKQTAIVVPVGDSITVGVGDALGEGYRHSLYDNLSGYGVYFWGTVTASADAWGKHSGVTGDTTAQIKARVPALIASQFRPYYTASEVYVIIHAGTNDMSDASLQQTGCSASGTTLTCTGAGLTGLEGRVIGKNANGWRTIQSVGGGGTTAVVDSAFYSGTFAGDTANVIQNDFTSSVQNVEDMIDLFYAVDSDINILVSLIIPSYAIDSSTGHNDAITAFNVALSAMLTPKIATVPGLRIIDDNAAITSACVPLTSCYNDYLHPNATGYAVMANTRAGTIN